MKMRKKRERVIRWRESFKMTKKQQWERRRTRTSGNVRGMKVRRILWKGND